MTNPPNQPDKPDNKSSQDLDRKPSLKDASKASKDAATKRPEAVQYMLIMWLAVIILETFHQLVSVALSLLNSDQLLAAARRATSENDALPDVSVRIAAYGSVALSALIAFAIIGLLAYFLYQLANNTKRAGVGRRMLFAFSLYFGLRIMFVFMSRPSGANAEWLFAADGMLQILIGVLALMGLMFSVKEETLKHTGEYEEMKKLEAEARKKAEEKAREKEQERKRQQEEERQREKERDKEESRK